LGIFIANNIITHNCRCAVGIVDIIDTADQEAG
jgi:hypothetical protein